MRYQTQGHRRGVKVRKRRGRIAMRDRKRKAWGERRRRIVRDLRARAAQEELPLFKIDLSGAMRFVRNGEDGWDVCMGDVCVGTARKAGRRWQGEGPYAPRPYRDWATRKEAAEALLACARWRS